MKALRCTNCGVVFIGATGPGDDAVYQSFKAHMESHQIVGAPTPTAPLPMTHGMRSVERGNLASRATVTGNRTGDPLPARMTHPSARLAAIPGGAA